MTRIRCDGKGRRPEGSGLTHSQPRVPGLPCVSTVHGSALASRGAPICLWTVSRTARLYLCTDARRERGDLAEFADAALAGGVDIIQLRDKGSVGEQRFGPLEAREELAALEVLADAARRHGALFAVNDRADIARAAGADVLHLGQDDLPLLRGPRYRRRPIRDRALHPRPRPGPAAVGEEQERLDYFCVGPCWPTPTKPGRTAPGLDLVRADRRTRHRPNRGSPSVASTSSDYPRCSMPAPAVSWWSGRSPRPTIRRRRLGVWPQRYHQRDSRSHLAQLRPAGGETRVQRQRRDLVLGHPAQLRAFPVGHGGQQYAASAMTVV